MNASISLCETLNRKTISMKDKTNLFRENHVDDQPCIRGITLYIDWSSDKYRKRLALWPNALTALLTSTWSWNEVSSALPI